MSLKENNFINNLNKIYKISYADRLKYEYELSDHWKKYYENQFTKFSDIKNIIILEIIKYFLMDVMMVINLHPF